MNLNNRMLNIDKKTIKKNKKRKQRKKQIKNSFFHKKLFFIEIKNQKIKNGFLYNTRCSCDGRGWLHTRHVPAEGALAGINDLCAHHGVSTHYYCSEES